MVAAVQTVTETAKGLRANTVNNRDYRFGDAVSAVGANSASVVLTLEKNYTQINLACDGLTGTNDFDLPAGEHGQEILVTLASKGSGNATITPDSGVTIVDMTGGTDAAALSVATITFDVAAEYALMRYNLNRWEVTRTNATLA